MRTPAESHATKLVREYGRAKALEIVRQKLEDAPFMVNGDRNFWIAVKECLR